MNTPAIRHILLLLLSVSGCGKDKGDATESCLTACHAIAEADHSCGSPQKECESYCKKWIDDAGGEDCTDEQIQLYDCAAEIDFEEGCPTGEEMLKLIVEACAAEITELGECTGDDSDNGFSTGFWGG